MASTKTCDWCHETAALDKAQGRWIRTTGLQRGVYDDSYDVKAEYRGEFCSPACVSGYFAEKAGIDVPEGNNTRRLLPAERQTGLLGRLFGL